MKLEALHKEWEADSVLPDELELAIRNVPFLHGKWWRIYTTERATYIALKQEYNQLRRDKFEWYLGRLDDAVREARGWPPQHLRIVRQEVEQYLTSDTELVPLAGRIDVMELKLKFIEDVIKSINNRGYLIKTTVEWLRFSNGS